jgi:hypothetical protein
VGSRAGKRSREADKPHLTPSDLRILREACLIAECMVQEQARAVNEVARRGQIDAACLKKLVAHGNTAARRFDAIGRKIEEMLGE